MPPATPGLFFQSSPRAILDRFVGPNDAIHAPEWAQWEEISLEFQQPKRTFAALFMHFAASDDNQRIVRAIIPESRALYFSDLNFPAAWAFIPDGPMGSFNHSE